LNVPKLAWPPNLQAYQRSNPMPGIITTFYSYKGGVGRTFALANIAVVLSSWGYRVLCIDWDLDAPGLRYYLLHWLDEPIGGGLVDAFQRFSEGGGLDFQDFTLKVRVSEQAAQFDFLPSGADGANYVATAQGLDWASLYSTRDLGSHLEQCRAEWMSEYDVVLIDSRTGITDIGGICTAQLPDIVVMMFTANNQSLEGTLEVSRRAHVARDALPYDRSRLMIVPVPSRFDAKEEYRRAHDWQERFQSSLSEIVSPWLHQGVSIETLLGYLTIPYVPYWSFGEEIPAAGKAKAMPGDITYALETLASLLALGLDRTELLDESRDLYVGAASRMLERFSYDVFLSYEGSEQVLASRCADLLRRQSLRVFEFSRERYSSTTSSDIARCRHCVVMLGDGPSKKLPREVEVFVRQSLDDEIDRQIFPIVGGDRPPSSLPTILRGYKLLPLRSPEEIYQVAAEISGQIHVIKCKEALEAARRESGPQHLTALHVSSELGSSQRWLGELAQQRGELAEAEEQFGRALAAFREAGDRSGEAEVCRRLGDLAEDRGELAEAEEQFGRALAAFREAGDRSGEAEVCRRLGDLAQQRGELAEAEEQFGRALAAFREAGDRSGEGEVCRRLGDLAEDRGELAEAEEQFGRALAAFREAEDLAGAAAVLFAQGRLAERHGDNANAERLLHESLKVAESVGSPDVASIRSRLGILATARGQPQEGMEYQLSALGQRQEMNSPEAEIDIRWLAEQRRLVGEDLFAEALSRHFDRRSAASLRRRVSDFELSKAPGTVIRVSERGTDAGGVFRVRLSFGDSAEYEVEITRPADEAAKENLAWYFEGHLRHPFLDADRGRGVAQQIAAYGEALFSQLFGGDASEDYRRLRDRSFDECRLEVDGSAALHRLHWETLRDPDLDAPLAVRLPVTRRVDRLGVKFKAPSGRPTLNILVITARPGGHRGAAHRTIARPLLEALRTEAAPVTVDLVRPGTWEGLRDHLRLATEQHGSGWYQVVHFDMYGSFSDYAALEEGRREGRLRSLGQMTPFAGRRGFLFFETTHEGQAGPVAMEAVASLLSEHRVPVAMLSACGPATQSANEAELAQKLAEAGIPAAIGMAYPVTLSAAVQALPVLYGRLAVGADLATAIQAARWELFEHPGRQAYFGQVLDLDDWMLPVLFAHQPLQIQLQDMTGDEQAELYERATAIGDEPTTEYGFVGRDLDIQAIERHLLVGQNGNELLVQGMAGAGTSTLLAHLAWWWQRTGLVEQVFRFSYEDRAWTCGQIFREVRSRLLSPAESARADIMSDSAQLELVAQLLRATRHLLILDNTESITGAPAAIPHSLNAAEQGQVKKFLSRLLGGRTLVLLGSREHEAWLTADGGLGIYSLPGLDPQAASLLVERILSRHGGARYLEDETERQALQDLVALLGGYPLPLTVVLPVLAVTPPSAVLAELQTGGHGTDPAGLIRRTIEYSYGKLDPAMQNSLLLLAPFTAVIGTGQILDRYQELLLQDEAVQRLGPIDLTSALGQAVSVGLAAPHPQIGYLVQVQPVLPYFLRNSLSAQPDVRAAAYQAHYELYATIGPQLHQMLISPDDPKLRAAGMAAARAEYANLTSALGHGLRTGQRITELIVVLDEYLDQAQQHDARRQLLDEVVAAYQDHASQSQQRELAVVHHLAGATAFTQRRFNDARAHYETELQLQQVTGDRSDEAVAYDMLGAVAQAQRRFEEAEASYRRALDLKLEFGDRHSAASTYQRLGTVAQAQRRFEEAEASYRRALDLKLEFGDRHSAASTYQRLGTVAEDQERFEEAEASYRQALDIYLEFGDRCSAASTYQRLGVVAHLQQRFSEAEAMYRRALDIYLEFGDQYGAAGTYLGLGTSARDLRRFGEAEAMYRRALDIYLESGDRYSAAGTYRQLGTVAEDQERFEESEADYRQALDIYRESDPQAASVTATRLGIVLAQKGQHGDAVTALLYAATAWYQATGQWDSQDLQLLNRERRLIEPAEFTALVKAHIPASLTNEFTAAMGT
jgi:tetratricopeptide (TPR) repeat protein/cellulose biosynthesis protein BcsQ